MLSFIILITSFTDLLNSIIDDIKKIINPNYIPSDNPKWF
jgi:hypothetical protein